MKWFDKFFPGIHYGYYTGFPRLFVPDKKQVIFSEKTGFCRLLFTPNVIYFFLNP